ncbi:glutamyl-tRNA reductase [bacterium]|nr:glutamyl-tRNA reductase [bacterium]
MEIGVLGTDFRQTPIAMREQLCMDPELRDRQLQNLRKQAGFSECVFLTTCNRVELYVAAPDIQSCLKRLKTVWVGDTSDVGVHAYYHDVAIEHLFSVTSGLKSMVLGESEILGQVKQAYQQAANAQLTGPYLNKLFQSSIALGKRVREETGIAQGVYSISSIAVDQFRDNNLEFFGEAVLVIGAGTMARRAVKKMVAIGHSFVTLTNRTESTGEVLAAELGVAYVPWESAFTNINHYPNVLVAVGAKTPVIIPDMITRTSMMIIDLGMPRNVHSDVDQRPGVSVTLVDDLTTIANRNVSARKQAYGDVEMHMQEQRLEYQRWVAYRQAAIAV